MLATRSIPEQKPEEVAPVKENWPKHQPQEQVEMGAEEEGEDLEVVRAVRGGRYRGTTRIGTR